MLTRLYISSRTLRWVRGLRHVSLRATSPQCHQSLNEVIEDLDGQMPTCLYQDTVNFENEAARQVPLDAMQFFAAMWHTQIPTVETDQFTFEVSETDWYKRQERFVPSRLDYPFLTWEQNLERVRQFLTNSFATSVRRTVASVVTSVPTGVSMPCVLIARIPHVNCSAPKFAYLPSLASRAGCEKLVLPLHDIVDDVLRAAHGEPLLGLPAVEAPHCLRLVSYRPITATTWSEYRDNYTGQPIAPGEYLCPMSDGAHFDTSVWFPMCRGVLAICIVFSGTRCCDDVYDRLGK